MRKNKAFYLQCCFSPRTLFFLFFLNLLRIFSYFVLRFRQVLLSKTCGVHVKVKLCIFSICSSSDPKSLCVAPLTAAENQHIRQQRFSSSPPVNHCVHCHNRSLIISVMICLEKQPGGNKSKNSQLASENNFCGPSSDCGMLLPPSVSAIKNISLFVGAGCG